MRKLKFITVNSQNNPPRTVHARARTRTARTSTHHARAQVPVGKRSYPNVPSKIGGKASASPARAHAPARPHSAHEVRVANGRLPTSERASRPV